MNLSEKARAFFIACGSRGGKSTSESKVAAAIANINLINERKRLARERESLSKREAVASAMKPKRKFGKQLPGELGGYADYNKRGAK